MTYDIIIKNLYIIFNPLQSGPLPHLNRLISVDIRARGQNFFVQVSFISLTQFSLPLPFYLTTFVFRSFFTKKIQTAVIYLFLKLEENVYLYIYFTLQI